MLCLYTLHLQNSVRVFVCVCVCVYACVCLIKQKAEIAHEMDEGVEALLCMFPTLTVEDAEDFLGLAGGNLQAAADLVLESPHPNKIGGKVGLFLYNSHWLLGLVAKCVL